MTRQTITWLNRSTVIAALIIAGSFVPANVVLGQSADQNQDGPGRGVARLSLLNGDVTVRRGDSGDWIAAAVNAPLLVDDRIMSGPGARSEVQLDYYDRIRMGSDSEIRFSELEWQKYQVQVARGTVIFSALPGTNDQIEFATPAASLRPLAAGSYRMSVMGDGSVEFTVRRGEAEVYTPQGTRRLASGRSMRVHLSQENIPEFQDSYGVPRDAFDEFSERRDQDLQQSKSYQYVSRDVPGAEDLDNAGEWVDQPPYGRSWRPYVAPGWAPYREGRWVWADDDYGWSWLSYDPWGWAPYHYGRWFCSGDSWYWNPGPFGGRHYWSPGLVAFFGYGGFGVGIGFGGLGWVPLAPFETYHPWYGRHGFGGNRYSVVNNFNIRNNYRNARVGNGVSGVNARDFGRGAPVRPTTVGARDLARTSVMRGSLPINPTRDSLRMSDRQVSSALSARTAQSGNNRFIASRSAPPSNRTRFGSPSGAIQSTGNSASSVGLSRPGTSQNMPMRGAAQAGTGGVARSATQNGWTRMGSNGGRTGNNSAAGSPQSAASPARGGWSSFGTPSGGRNVSAENATAVRGSVANSTASQRGGWTSFGSPERASSSGIQPARGGSMTSGNAGAANSIRRSESPSRSPSSGSGGFNSGAAQPSRGSWSTGISINSRSDYSRSASPSRSPASSSGGFNSGAAQPSRGSWSTGGSTNSRSGYSRSEAPSRSPASSSGGWNNGGGQPSRGSWGSSGGSSPRYSAPARSSAPSYSSGGGGSRQSSPAPSRSGGGGGGVSHSSGGHSSRR